MPRIPIRIRSRRRPFVVGVVFVHGRVFEQTPIQFLVDTGSQYTFISPYDEARLKNESNGLEFLGPKFCSGVKDLSGISGSAATKAIIARNNSDTGVAFFPTGDEPHAVYIHHLLFADETKPIIPRYIRLMAKITPFCPKLDHIQIIAGAGRRYSILGQDVLSQLGLVLAANAAYLSTDKNNYA